MTGRNAESPGRVPQRVPAMPVAGSATGADRRASSMGLHSTHETTCGAPKAAFSGSLTGHARRIALTLSKKDCPEILAGLGEYDGLVNLQLPVGATVVGSSGLDNPGSLAQQMVVVKFGGVVVKGASYAHYKVNITR